MEWDFSQNQEIDEATLGNAPEGYRGAYAKGDDGKFRIADGFKPFVDAISGLGTALKNERKVSGTLKGQKDVGAVLKEHLGFETVEDAKARLEELTQQVATASKVDPAKIKADIETTFNGKMAEKDKQLEGMQGTLRRYMVESAAVSALAEAKGSAKLLLPLIREQVDLVQDGEEWVVRVKDGQGDYRGNGQGGFMSVADLVAEMSKSKDYAAAFEAEQRPGTLVNRDQRVPGRQATQGLRTQGATPASANDRIAAGLAQRRGR
jgi:hypothetical protein